MSLLRRGLVSGFLDCADRYPDRPALSIQDQALTYRDLRSRSASIAATLSLHADESATELTGVLGHRSFAAFSGVLGSLMRGDGYVPLNPSFPADRTASMINRARLRRIVVEAASFKQLEAVLPLVDFPLCILVPDLEDLADIQIPPGKHRFLGADDLVCGEQWQQPEFDSNTLAYLLFTSGSTGQPKGVMVTQRNVMSFVDFMATRYEVTEHDRFSQTFDLTFDLSAFDMFVAWDRGACVCCPTQGQKLFPSKYIDSQRITIWFSVPSTAIMMKKMKMLSPARYPNLRFSLFCGEALPLEVAESFAQAAPNSVVENLYGPTELTIACTFYRYESQMSQEDAEHGVVPIGEPYPGMSALVADDELRPVEAGEPGELLMTGPQLSLGYWEDPERTATAYVVPPDHDQTYYRTGDRVRRRSSAEPLLYLGRVDSQIKVQGYRVELGEIEAIIRELAKVDEAIAIGYPRGATGAEGIIAFISDTPHDPDQIRQQLSTQLPFYMLPSTVIAIRDFPLNANGKIDRNALLVQYEQEIKTAAKT